MSLARESRAPVRMESSDIELRKGKWTVEEENYANKIITLFNQGMLPVVAGTTLRTYLSDKLRCDPMRITKKYAGASCIGKQVFQLCDNYYECFQENERELQRLENLFLIRINGKGGGLSGKRGTGEAPVPHQSIYETATPDTSQVHNTSTTSTTSTTKRPYKTNRRGSGSGSGNANKSEREHNLSLNFVMLGGSPRLVNHRHSAEQKAGFSPQFDQYRSGSEYDELSDEDNHLQQHQHHSQHYYNQDPHRTSQGRAGDEDEEQYQEGEEEEEEGDYGYAYDPENDPESALRHATQQAALRQYHYEELMRQQPAGKGGIYSSLQAGGRRVLSAPNLTELNLSSWKNTDYRPLPADSLKEMFSQPIGGSGGSGMGGSGMGGSSGGSGGVGYEMGGMYGGNGQQYAGANHLNGSLLPEHVYTAMGSESGRYAGHHANHSNKTPPTTSAVMAARARATKLALQHHQQELGLGLGLERSPHPYHTSSQRAVDDAHFATLGLGGLGGAGGGIGGKPRMKRSHSAMALMDFEKLAGDDTAAGDFFVQFLNKVSGTSNTHTNTNTPRRASKTEAHSASAIGAEGGAVSASGVADLLLEEPTHHSTTTTTNTNTSTNTTTTATHVADSKVDVVSASDEPAGAHAYVPAVSTAVVSAAVVSTVVSVGADAVDVVGGGDGEVRDSEHTQGSAMDLC